MIDRVESSSQSSSQDYGSSSEENYRVVAKKSQIQKESPRKSALKNNKIFKQDSIEKDKIIESLT